jgi:signal transduction histidine kinase
MAVRQGTRLKELIEQLLLAAWFEQAGGEPVRLVLTRFGALAVLAVEDTGPGVPAADRERVFERFTQLDSGATRRAGGVGLGLSIARQLAHAQGGELVCTDPAGGGQGARFELRLPLAELAFRRPG